MKRCKNTNGAVLVGTIYKADGSLDIEDVRRVNLSFSACVGLTEDMIASQFGSFLHGCHDWKIIGGEWEHYSEAQDMVASILHSQGFERRSVNAPYLNTVRRSRMHLVTALLSCIEPLSKSRPVGGDDARVYHLFDVTRNLHCIADAFQACDEGRLSEAIGELLFSVLATAETFGVNAEQAFLEVVAYRSGKQEDPETATETEV
jgi:hypothetical protein